MSPDNPSSPEPHPDSRSVQIRAARDQFAAARRRAQRHVQTVRLAGASDPAAGPYKSPPGYTLLRELHRGGQGIVYLAIQESTGRQVAVKLLYGEPPATIGATELARFAREIEILSRLKHPNIVTIHDCGRDDDRVYLVMDYVQGRPLDAFVDRDRTPISETLALFARICDGVNAAHLRGVVHRDLKPGNILVDESGAPHVLDFGLAKLSDDSAYGLAARTMTITGQFVGSLPWASPEQAEGRTDHLDVRTDVYSLGVVLYQLLTGRFPYPVTGRLDEVVRHIVNTLPARPSALQRTIDRELDTILLKCLAKEPERRYQNAGELARDLRRYLAGQAIDAKGDSTWYIICKQLRRHRALLLAGCAFLLLLLASSVIAWSLYASAVRARNAEQARVWDSLVAQARAERSGDRVGRRTDSLDAIRRARDIRFERELRDDAVACLALPDLRRVAEWQNVPMATARGLRTIDRFACVIDEHRVEIRAVRDGSVIKSFDPVDASVVPLCFSPDGELIATKTISQNRNELWLWDIATRKCRTRFSCSAYNFGLFSKDGRLFGVVQPAGSVSVFDIPRMQRVADISPGFSVASFEFDVTAARLALVAADSPVVAVWSIPQARLTRTLRLPAAPYAATWSSDSSALAVGAEDHSVYLCDMTRDEPPRALPGHRGQVVTVAFDTPGVHLVSGGWDRQVRVWDLSRGANRMATFVGCHLAGLADRLAVRQHDRIGIWEFLEVDVFHELRANADDCARKACFVGGDRWIAASGANGIRLFDALHPGAAIPLDARATRRPVSSADGRHVVALVDNQVIDWTLSPAPDGGMTASRRVVPIPETPGDVTLAADQHTLLVTSGSDIVLHDFATGDELRRAEIGLGAEAPALSPDGRYAFVGNWKGSRAASSVVDMNTMQVIRYFPGESVAGVFSGDSEHLAVCTPSKLELWDMGIRRLRWFVSREPGQELAVRPAFSPDGSLVAMSSSLYEIHIVSAQTGDLILRLPNPSLHMIGDLQFSSDGGSLLAATSSSVIQVWNLTALRRDLSALRLDW